MNSNRRDFLQTTTNSGALLTLGGPGRPLDFTKGKSKTNPPIQIMGV